MIKKTVEYFGIEKPSTPLEIDFEISGLELAILKAQSLIKTLQQSKLLAQLELEKINKKNV